MKIITRVQLSKAPLKVLLSCVNLIHKGIASGLIIQIQLLIKTLPFHSNEWTYELIPVSMLSSTDSHNEKFH